MNPDEGERELDAAIREGAVHRVRPKAMTVEVILAGLFPIPVGTGAGSEVRSLAISHQPVAALDWPAMTMSFMAPGIDLDMLMKGDHIQFDFNSVGMDGTVTRIERSKTP